jgi:hypothetical protein
MSHLLQYPSSLSSCPSMTKISTWSFSFRFAHQRFAGITGRAGRSGCRIPVGRDFPPSVPTDPGAHSVSYTMGTGLLPGVRRMGHVVDHQLPTSVEVKERLESYLYSPRGPSGPVLGSHLTLPSLGFTKPTHYFSLCVSRDPAVSFFFISWF